MTVHQESVTVDHFRSVQGNLSKFLDSTSYENDPSIVGILGRTQQQCKAFRVRKQFFWNIVEV